MECLKSQFPTAVTDPQDHGFNIRASKRLRCPASGGGDRPRLADAGNAPPPPRCRAWRCVKSPPLSTLISLRYSTVVRESAPLRTPMRSSLMMWSDDAPAPGITAVRRS
ncbi:hypothetical protein GE21DRAFT_8153 [Neurospora crassa]|uniref:Uncharacterized protein n=1 Tax=Neurospora crassa (strain ATCC 24698 / 74-OR23-1A / CBS 708.71 / DSM 1257 / FGSC 987) TaxID=367110 RepID=Q7S7T7_NEUCR|nr:hypothetical protein NCU04162 [Neurospora crassa OR74A]EAA32082.1 hypothetical protein NCU04162 [Neurospora crassa OR74A]KHE87356.1 hypothetical protein GE21DRAFT_8153 [Neurospora crassa]|eukprot:XP_961318.1 hypothetical protein NCU04162 [Neurospora crassa OR74A]